MHGRVGALLFVSQNTQELTLWTMVFNSSTLRTYIFVPQITGGSHVLLQHVVDEADIALISADVSVQKLFVSRSNEWLAHRTSTAVPLVHMEDDSFFP